MFELSRFLCIVTLKFREVFKVTNDSGCEEFPDRSLSQKTVLTQSDIHDSKICPAPTKSLPFGLRDYEITDYGYYEN